jgi:hypothetical protein
MPPSLSEQVRRALRDSGRPDVEVATAAGIHPVTLSRFKTGNFSMSAENTERLAAALGLEIHVRKSPQKSANRA